MPNELIREIETLPVSVLDELYNYIGFIKNQKAQKAQKASDIALASERVLAREWLTPEEDEAWAHL
ncbi:MAG: DUF2281 domain-containing protein [Oscillospiraceae bacterium]|jgi:hypothetical protein|nr:DUF2281 domain-containing protein [Oscillospiraceae bacterium]